MWNWEGKIQGQNYYNLRNINDKFYHLLYIREHWIDLPLHKRTSKWWAGGLKYHKRKDESIGEDWASLELHLTDMEAEKYVLYDLQWLNIKNSIPAKRRNGDEGVGGEGFGFISKVFEAHHSKRYAQISTNKLKNQPN